MSKPFIISDVILGVVFCFLLVGGLVIWSVYDDTKTKKELNDLCIELGHEGRTDSYIGIYTSSQKVECDTKIIYSVKKFEICVEKDKWENCYDYDKKWGVRD